MREGEHCACHERRLFSRFEPPAARAGEILRANPRRWAIPRRNRADHTVRLLNTSMRRSVDGEGIVSPLMRLASSAYAFAVLSGAVTCLWIVVSGFPSLNLVRPG